jgi:hypothetical protein
MILVRDIFQLKFGKAREAKALWKEGAAGMNKAGMKVDRILTDLTGPYYTLVMETSHNSLTDFEKAMKQETGTDEFRKFYQKFVELVESGRREIFTVEDI